MGKMFLFGIFFAFFCLGILSAEMWLAGEVLKMLIVFVFAILAFWRFCGANTDLRTLAVLIFGFCFGFLRFWWADLHGAVDFEEGYREITGCVVEEVDVRNDGIKYTLDTVDFGRVLVNAPLYPAYRFGDCLRTEAVLERPGVIEDFQYDKYLARYRIYAMANARWLEKTGEARGGVIFRTVFWLKGQFEDKLSQIFGEPHASFMAGLVLGSRKGIPDDLMEKFNITGLTHIIAVSGYNITLVITFVAGFFSFLGRKTKVVVSSVFVTVFVVLVGASAAVVRAGIMGIISLLALWFGRQYMVLMALFWSGFLMNLINPRMLTYDVGFQLSFLATLGLILLSEKLTPYFQRVPETFGFRESIVLTMSAQAIALPLIIYKFGRLSFVSPLANLMVLPFIPMAMMFGFVAGFLSFISEILGKLFGIFGYLILELIIFLVEALSKIPFASVEIGFLGWWFLPLYYFWLLEKLR